MTKKRPVAAVTFAIAVAFPAVALAQGSVRITAPVDGATLGAMTENKLTYEVDPGPTGDHVHIYVDGEEVGILRQLKGSYVLERLAPGSRTLCVKVVNKGHTPIGVEECVRVTVR